MPFKVTRRWTEIGADGQPVAMRWAEFGSIPEQLDYLRKMIDVYRATTWARKTAMEIIRAAQCEARNHACFALAIGEAVQSRIMYVREFPERFQTPPNTWADQAGDCDDFTTLIGSLLESVGVQVKVVGMKVNGKWRHVYPVAQIEGPGGKKLPMNLDATLRGVPVREMANPITRALERGMVVETLVL
jgi:hypothetical protein